jgi:hypothetical protein
MSVFDPAVFPTWLAFASWLLMIVACLALVVCVILAWAAVDEWAGKWTRPRWYRNAWRGLTVALAVLAVTWLLAWGYVVIDAQDNPSKYRRPAEAEPAR